MGWGELWDSPIQALPAFTVPFFIWQNEAARREMDLEVRAEALGLCNGDIEISVFYLGAMLMQVLELDQWSPFIAHVNALREHLPVARLGVYRETGGLHQETLPEQLRDMFDFYRGWSYYKVFVQTVG